MEDQTTNSTSGNVTVIKPIDSIQGQIQGLVRKEGLSMRVKHLHKSIKQRWGGVKFENRCPYKDVLSHDKTMKFSAFSPIINAKNIGTLTH